MREESIQTAPEGLEKLFLDNHRRIYQAAYRITGSAADAEDVLQTVFLRLLRRGESAPLTGLPASYLHLAAVNGALDVVRSRVSARATGIDENEPSLTDAPSGRPDAQYRGGETRERLRGALARLNPAAAEIFVLRYLEGYTNLEIARMLGKRQTMVAVTLHRARRRLREEFRPTVGGKS